MLGIFQGNDTTAKEAKRASRDPIVGVRKGKGAKKAVRSDDEEDEPPRRGRKGRDDEGEDIEMDKINRGGGDGKYDRPSEKRQQRRRGGRKGRQVEQEEEKRSEDEYEDSALEAGREEGEDDGEGLVILNKKKKKDGDEEGEEEKESEEDQKQEGGKAISIPEEPPLTRLEKDRLKKEERAKGYRVGEWPTPEIKYAYWSLGKIIFYILYVSAAAFIIGKDYHLNPCETFSYNFCVWSTYTVKCIPPTDDYTVCRDACQILATEDDPLNKKHLDGNYGCYWNITENTTTCYRVISKNHTENTTTIANITAPNGTIIYNATVVNGTRDVLDQNFTNLCQDDESCPASDYAISRRGLIYTSIFLIISAAWEGFILCGLCSFADIHVDEIGDLSVFNKCLVVILKLSWLLQQVLFTIVVITYFYLIYGYGTEHNKCPNAKDTVTLEPFRFYEYASYYIGALTGLLIFNLALGMYMRFNILLRGELYQPSNDEEITVPLDLDCRSCREAPGPQTCTRLINCFRMCAPRGKTKWCPDMDSVQWSCDMFWCFCVGGECWGNAFEKCYKYRHFIGP